MAKITIGRVLNKLTDSVTVAQGDAGEAWPVLNQAQLVPVGYDYIGLSYDVSNPELLTQITYRSGGSSGTLLATVTLAYDSNNNLTSVTRV